MGGDTQKEAINGYKETLGTIKAIICKRPEERRTAIQKEILKQLEDGAVPSIAFCHETESQEWVSSLLKCTGMEMQNVDTDNVLTLSKMPLYLFCISYLFTEVDISNVFSCFDFTKVDIFTTFSLIEDRFYCIYVSSSLSAFLRLSLTNFGSVDTVKQFITRKATT